MTLMSHTHFNLSLNNDLSEAQSKSPYFSPLTSDPRTVARTNAQTVPYSVPSSHHCHHTALALTTFIPIGTTCFLFVPPPYALANARRS